MRAPGRTFKGRSADLRATKEAMESVEIHHFGEVKGMEDPSDTNKAA
jgi:hypothetical protein